MRPHGRASVDARYPQAFGICDRCGFLYNHHNLQWQYQWVAMKLQNIRLLVCKTCMDIPQEQLRRIIIPPDPVPIRNPRPELYSNADNPVSTIGADLITGFGTSIGTTSNLNAAFDGNLTKTFRFSANSPVSVSGLFNYVGKNWNAMAGNVAVATPVQQKFLYSITQFIAYAPTDAPFIGGGASVAFDFQGSLDGVTFTNLASGNTVGKVGEALNISVPGGGFFQYHRLVFTGDGINPFGIAQLLMYGTPQNFEGGL